MPCSAAKIVAAEDKVHYIMHGSHPLVEQSRAEQARQDEEEVTITGLVAKATTFLLHADGRARVRATDGCRGKFE